MQKLFQLALRRLAEAALRTRSPNYLPLAEQAFKPRALPTFRPEKPMFGFVRTAANDLHFLLVFRPMPKTDAFDLAVGWNTTPTVPDLPVWAIHVDEPGQPGLRPAHLALAEPAQLAVPWYLGEPPYAEPGHAAPIFTFHLFGVPGPTIDWNRIADPAYKAAFDRDAQLHREALQRSMSEPLDESTAQAKVAPVVDACMRFVGERVEPVFARKLALHSGSSGGGNIA